MEATRHRRRIATAAFLAVVAGAAVAAWQAWRPTAPAFVQRFEERVSGRFSGAQTSWLAEDLARVALPSGLMLDIAIARAKAACHSRPPACTDQLDRLTAAIDRVTGLAEKPRENAVRAVIVGELAPGYRYGYIAEPLIGPLEIRYALVDGDALTFITPTIADRLGVKPAALRGLASQQIELESGDGSGTSVEALSGEPGVYVARSTGDAPALLLSHARMQALADKLQTQRLYCAIPRRGLLLVAKADSAGRDALRRAIMNVTTTGRRTPFESVLVYDSGAPSTTALAVLN